MAKKPLTPEQAEIKAMKKAKKSENWTKFWAILLAAVLTFAVVAMGKTAAEDAIEKAKEQNQTENVGSNNTTDNGGTNTDPFANSGSNNGGTTDNNGGTTDNNGATNNGATNNGGTTDNGPSKADVIKVFNDTTAKAAKGSYKLHREGKFTRGIDVGSATSTLNDIIHGVDENASLDSVVGGFLGINKPVDADVVNGKGEGFDGKYMMKAMALTENDVDAVKVDGNKYMISIKKTITPDANSALAHATNDYITFDQVNASINEAVGSAVKVEASGSEAIYDKIVFTATVVDGKLTNLEYSYTFSATLAIKIAIVPATGTGEAEVKGVYSNIKY